jgi:hypothetical protein
MDFQHFGFDMGFFVFFIFFPPLFSGGKFADRVSGSDGICSSLYLYNASSSSFVIKNKFP